MTKSPNPPLSSALKCIAATGQPVKLNLAWDRIADIKRGHPWIFADALASRPAASPGSLAILKGKDGSVLAQGIYDCESPLAFRVCAVNPERFDDAMAFNRLRSAIELRKNLFGSSTTGYRLLNGEGDGLPGLVCDVYEDYAVWQLDGAGPAGFWDLQGLASAISNIGGHKNSFRKARTGEADSNSYILLGGAPPSDLVFSENGLRFEADVFRGQKTGFFFDQRENRSRVRELSAGRRVLNLFGYTGGFSIYAGKGGATSVTTVDLAKPAIETAIRNWKLNGFDAALHEGVAADAFEFVDEAARNKQFWDLVIVDPPSFAHGKQYIDKARSAYIAIFSAAAKVCQNGGVLAASSCSSYIDPDTFLEICGEAVSKARRRATILGVYGQPADHPFPLACRELRYLKFVLLRLD